MTHNASTMSESGLPSTAALLAEGAGPTRSVLQIYRCPKGHLNKILWTAGEMALASEHNDIKFYCQRCESARLATPAEAASLMAALGLAPAKRTYSA